jgi:hypothetical protein
MPDKNVEVRIRPLLPGQWRWQVRYGGSFLGIRNRKAGVAFGRQDAVNRAKAFLAKKGLEAVVPGDEVENG